MDPKKEKKTTPGTSSETGTEEKGENLSLPPLKIGASGNGRYDIMQNVNKSNAGNHWVYLPGQGKEGHHTAWGTKSTESW